MNKSKKIERIKTLIDRLEKNQSITRGSLSRVLGEVGIGNFDRELQEPMFFTEGDKERYSKGNVTDRVGKTCR